MMLLLGHRSVPCSGTAGSLSPGTAPLILRPFAHTNPLLMPRMRGPARGRAGYLNSPGAGRIQQGGDLRFPVCWELGTNCWRCGT